MEHYPPYFNLFFFDYKKYEKYWPDLNECEPYGKVSVHNVKEQIFTDYIFRTFKVSCGEETREVRILCPTSK